MNFDWQTDEDEKEWEPEQTLVVASRRSGRRWVLVFLVGVAVLLAAVALYRRFNQQVETVTRAAEQDVLDSYQLLRQAAEQQDRELFFLVLSGLDPAWTNNQQDLLESNLLFDRSPLGLTAVPDGSEVISVSVSPELASAELVYEQHYLVDAGDTLSQTVSLRQTAVFRHGGGRWLYAPPEADFWGNPVAMEREQVSLLAPGLDEEIAGRLADDLAEAIAEVCTLVTASQMDCPHLTIYFDTNPTSVLATLEPAWLLQSGHVMTLPTPSLVGLPTDEAGYQALRQGYTLPAVARLFNEATGWQCCERVYFYQAMLDWQLAELGLRSWPLSPADYEVIMDRPWNYTELLEFWSAAEANDLTGEAKLRLYALVEFVLRRSPLPPLAEQQRLAGGPLFHQWTATAFGPFQGEIILAGEWKLFTYERSLSAQRQSPIPLPDEEITLICASHPDQLNRDGLFDLYQYNLAADSYVRTLLLRRMGFFVELSGSPYLVIGTEEERDGGLWSQIWLYQGGQKLIYQQPIDDEPNWFFNPGSSTRDHLVMSYFGEDRSPHYALTDLNRCDLEGCSLQELLGRPVWSPDGTRLLVTAMDNVAPYPTIWFGDGQANNLFLLSGGGDLPFWLDNETFGYIELDLEANVSGAGVIFQPIVIRGLEQQVPQLIASNESLRELVPVYLRPDGLFIQGIFPIPDGSGRLLIRGLDWSSRLEEQPAGTFFFLVDPQTGDHIWLFGREMLFTGTVYFSPDGRWLAMYGSEPVNSERRVFLYNLDQNRLLSWHTELLGSFGWSADGQWFWQVQNDLLYLIAPDYDYRVVRPLPLEGCQMAAGGG
jgi:hypothetical protein